MKVSPAKERLGATKANFHSHRFAQADVRPDVDNVAVLTDLLMPTLVKQVHSLLGGGFSYYMGKRTRPITSPLKQNVKCVFTPDVNAIVRG